MGRRTKPKSKRVSQGAKKIMAEIKEIWNKE